MERTVPSTCLGQTQSTKCLKWDGPAYPALDIQTGDSLEWVLDKIVSNLESTSEDSESVDLGCLVTSGTSSCAAHVTYRTLVVNKTSGTGGVATSWDSSAIQTGLPQGYSLQMATVLFRGKDGTIHYSGSSATAQTTIPLSAFPVTLDYTLYIYTPCGTVRLATTSSISANPGADDVVLTFIDAPAAAQTVSSLKEAIELIAAEVCSLKNKI